MVLKWEVLYIPIMLEAFECDGASRKLMRSRFERFRSARELLVVDCSELPVCGAIHREATIVGIPWSAAGHSELMCQEFVWVENIHNLVVVPRKLELDLP